MSTKSRTLILSRHPRNHITLDPDSLLICPGDIAARQLGRSPFSLDDAAKAICESNRMTIAPEHTTLRVLAAVISEFYSSEDASGVARTMLSAVNLLYREGADLADIFNRTSGQIHQVARAALETRARLRREYMLSKADAIAAAPNLISLPRTRCVVVFGFARLIPAEYRLLDTIAGPGSRIYLPYSPQSALFKDSERTAEYLRERGWEIAFPDDAPKTTGQIAADMFVRLPANLSGVRARSCPTLEDEVRCTLRDIKSAIVNSEYDFENVAIVARSESSYGDLIREIAFEYEVPVRTHYSVPLLNTRLGQWLSTILEVSEPADFPFEATARVALHSLGADLQESGWSPGDWNTARKDHTRGTAAWNALHVNTEVLNWPSEQSRKAWCESIVQLLESLHVRSHSMFRPQDIAACESLYDGLRELALTFDNADENLSRQAFVLQLRELMRASTVPSDLTQVGIEVHTPLSLYGAEVKHLYVLGAAEGSLPMPVADDALLDFHERYQLAASGFVELESAARAARRETLSFYSLLLAATESITFSFARLQGNSEAKPSPFLTRMSIPIEGNVMLGSTVASESELLHYQIGRAADIESEYVSRARRACGVVQNRELGFLDEYTGNIDTELDFRDIVFSPAQITTFGQCCYRWFAQKLLGLADPEEAEDDLAANLKGMLYHDTLSRGLEACKQETDIREAMILRLEQDFDEAAAAIPALNRLPGWKGRRPELLRQLREAIESERFLLKGSAVIYTERSFEGEWNGLRVRGRLDRMDKLNNQPIVIDYKTSGSKPKGAKSGRGDLSLDVQLPIYMTVGAAALARGRSAAGGYYLSLTTGEHLGEYNMGFSKNQKSPDEQSIAALASRIKSRLKDGHYPVDPDVDQNACEYCELDLVCRRGPYLTRLPQGICEEEA